MYGGDCVPLSQSGPVEIPASQSAFSDKLERAEIGHINLGRPESSRKVPGWSVTWLVQHERTAFLSLENGPGVTLSVVIGRSQAPAILGSGANAYRFPFLFLVIHLGLEFFTAQHLQQRTLDGTQRAVVPLHASNLGITSRTVFVLLERLPVAKGPSAIALEADEHT